MTKLDNVYLLIEKCVKIIKQTQNITKSHLNNFFLEDQWNYIPENIQSDLLSSEFNGIENSSDCINDVIDHDLWTFQNTTAEKLFRLIQQCNLHNIENFTNVQKKSATICSNLPKDAYNGMSAKKGYEVSEIADLFTSLCSKCGVETVVDLGSGLGYLSSFLSELFGFQVVGVDASEKHIVEMMDRATKLKKRRNRWIEKSIIQLPQNGVLHGTTTFIQPDTNLVSLVKGPIVPPHIGILGLHICGNLSADSCQLFINNPSAKVLLNIGCCYHLITEEFENNPRKSGKFDIRFKGLDPLHPTTNHIGFPLSNTLKKKKFSLTRNARMLSLQNSHNSENITSLYWRALLQVIIADKNGQPLNNPAGRNLPLGDFSKYCSTTLQRMQAPFSVTPQEANDYLEKYENKFQQFKQYHLLRQHLAPVIETILVLDKLAYLLEQGVMDSTVQKVFDVKHSPRCWAVISTKL